MTTIQPDPYLVPDEMLLAGQSVLEPDPTLVPNRLLVPSASPRYGVEPFGVLGYGGK